MLSKFLYNKIFFCFYVKFIKRLMLLLDKHRLLSARVFLLKFDTALNFYIK